LQKDQLAVCWAAHDEAARLSAEYGRRGEKMPLAAVLGGDPAFSLATAAPVPASVDACALAGLFREKPLDVIGCRSVDLTVPADAEIVIEGYVDPSEPAVEAGPVCSPIGHYRPVRPAPVVHVTAITHRANPIYPAAVPGKPPHEMSVVGRALARVFLPFARAAAAELVDYDLPLSGAGRQLAVVSIRKSHAGQARQVAHAVWGMPGMTFAKLLVVVDEGIDVRDSEEVLAAIGGNVHPVRDLFTRQGPPDPFDAATACGELGHSLGIDATAKLPGEHPGPWPERADGGDEIRRLVGDRWVEYGLGPE